jgi:uncharacterized membrane protein YgaE (UPF0421/DUF939 family)
MEGQNIPENTRKEEYLLVKLLTAVVVLWVLTTWAIYDLWPDWTVRGTVGDSFGAVNALFSGLAFAALVYTIILQRREIQLNRSEIELNRKELSKSVKAQKASQEALKQQVAQTHLSAKLNAMNTVIGYYNSQIESSKSTEDVVERAKEKRRQMIKKIDALIDGLENSEVE